MKPKLYLIPGMGADERLFVELHKHLDFECIPFLIPAPDEGLDSYAARMSQAIDTTEPFFIGGVSFGGMVASEIARQHKPVGVVYLSTAKTRSELPPWLRLFKWMPIYQVIPARILRHLWPRSPLPRTAEHKLLVGSMMAAVDPQLFRWSMHRAARFANRRLPEKWLHVHGTMDLLLPGAFVKGAHKIKGGEHAMVLSKPKEIAEVVRNWMEKQ